MKQHALWETWKAWQGSCRWVELSREVSLQTPHHSAFPDMEMEVIYNYDRGDGFQAHVYKMPGQYGTHVDAPIHMNETGATLDAFGAEELFLPLCVVDLSKAVAENPDYGLTVADLEAWEARNGRIPEGAFVAFRSDWYKKSNLDNPDENGQPHYPGWDKAAIQWLVEERNIGAIGHEPADTDPATVTTKEGAYPYPGEQYILQVDRIQIEVMRNLDQVPPVGSIIVIGFPKLKDGTGFPTRCFAICPVD